MSDFVHLRFHSEYSLMDSCCSIKSVKKECLKRNFSALAITDTNSIAGLIKFYKECNSKDESSDKEQKTVKPILGSLLHLCPNISDKEDNSYYPIILLSKDLTGLGNLKIISHISQTDGYNEKFNYPRVDYDVLSKYNEGLILISTDLNGSVQSLLRRRKDEQAYKEAIKFKDIFGENYYFEIQNNGRSDQEIVNKGILDLSKKINTKVVATNDVRYYSKDHYKAHLVLQALDERKTINSKKFTAFRTQERYFKTAEEMKLAFVDYPAEVLSNTLEVADKCNIALKFGGMRLPEYELPEGFESDWDYLKHLAYKGLKDRGLDDRKEYLERMEEELFDIKMIYQTCGYNFSRYFLIVWNYTNQAHDNGSRTGAGRGSACGSLLLYALKVTNVDPIKYGLYWWRFLTVDKKFYIDDKCFFGD